MKPLDIAMREEPLDIKGEVFKLALKDAGEQVVDLIRATRNVYNATPEFCASPIGKHVRHIVDHFFAYKHAISQDSVLDYNVRSRETALESDPELALNAVEEFNSWLVEQNFEEIDLVVESEVAVSESLSTTLNSNNHRELVYIVAHTFHHLAYANLLAKVLNVATPDHIGVAPATATFLREASHNLNKASQ